MLGLCVNCHLILITTAFIAVHFGKSKSDSQLAPVTCDNLPPDHKPSLIQNPNIKYREKIQNTINKPQICSGLCGYQQTAICHLIGWTPPTRPLIGQCHPVIMRHNCRPRHVSHEARQNNSISHSPL